MKLSELFKVHDAARPLVPVNGHCGCGKENDMTNENIYCPHCKNYSLEKHYPFDDYELKCSVCRYYYAKNDHRLITSEQDIVNHPEHYISKDGIESIDVIRAFTRDLEGIEAVCTANMLKYIMRWKHKNGLEDLKKAQWYLNYLITEVEVEDNE